MHPARSARSTERVPPITNKQEIHTMATRDDITKSLAELQTRLDSLRGRL
jgi:hypothetical protein